MVFTQPLKIADWQVTAIIPSLQTINIGVVVSPAMAESQVCGFIRQRLLAAKQYMVAEGFLLDENINSWRINLEVFKPAKKD
jgi:hypothetical protein